MVKCSIKFILQFSLDKKHCKILSITGLILIVHSSFFLVPVEAANYSNTQGTSIAIDDKFFSWESGEVFSEGELESSIQTLKKFISKSNPQKNAVNLAYSGLLYLQRGNIQQGLSELEQAWEIDPKLPIAGIMITTTHLKIKEYREALESAKKLQVNLPKESAGYTLAGLAHAGLNDPKRSRAAFQKALEVNQDDIDASANLATLAIKEEDFDQARSIYKETLIRRPGHLRTMMQLARLESISGQTEKAILLLKEAVNKYPETLQPRLFLAQMFLTIGDSQNALDVTEPVSEKYQKVAALLELIGIARMRSGLPLKAISVLESASQESPKTASLQYNLALAYEQLKEKDKAIQKIKKALKLDPDHAPSKFLYARLMAKKGQMESALNLLHELEKSYSGSPEISELEGRIAMAKNQPEKAIGLFKKALSRRETNNILIQLALAQMLTKQTNASYATLRNWLKRFPLDILTRSTLADMLLGNGQNDDAQTQYLEVVRLQPEISGAWNNLAWLLLQKGDMDEALEHAEKAYKIDPNNPQIMDTLGDILVRKNQPKKAIELLQKATKISPNDLNMHFHLAQAYAGTKYTEKARKLLTDILAKNQQFGQRQQAAELLNKLEEK